MKCNEDSAHNIRAQKVERQGRCQVVRGNSDEGASRKFFKVPTSCFVRMA